MAFVNISDNIMNIFNEVIIMGCFSSSLFLNLADASENFGKILGWVLIILIGLSLIITWLITLPDLLIESWKSINQICKSKNDNDVNEAKEKVNKTSPAAFLRADTDFKKCIVVVHHENNIKTQRDKDVPCSKTSKKILIKK